MKTDRLISIIMILLDRKRVGARELAEKLEVSQRTIYRDIEAISMAGIPITAVSGTGGGFEIMPDFKIDKSTFTADDLSVMLSGLYGMKGFVREGELAGAIAKLRHVIPGDQADDIEARANRIYIDHSPWFGGRHIQENLELIREAMRTNRTVLFSYYNGHGEQSRREAEPCQLVLKNNQWYFQAYCLLKKDFRLFRISRVFRAEITANTFEPRSYEIPRMNIDDIVADMQITITLRIHRSIVDRVLDVCPFDLFVPDGDAHYIVSCPFIENDYYYDMLLSYGNKCECMEPARVRDEMRRRIRQLADIYGE